MKRKMLLLTLALPVILCQNVKAQTDSRLVATADWYNDGVSFQFSDSTYNNYSSGRGGDLTHQLKYDNSTTWTYDTGTYSNAWNYIQRFDANNNDTSTIAQYWDPIGAVWVPYSNTLFFYNSSNKLTTKVMQSWNGTNWYPIAQDLYSYNSSGKLIIDEYYLYVSTTFVPTSQKTYYYDTSGNLGNETDQNFVSGVPIYTNLWSYTYSSTNQVLTTTFSVWNGSGWTPNNMYSNTYDTLGQMTYKLFQTYQSSDSTWQNDSFHIYSGYTSNNSPLQDVVQTWDPVAGAWDNLMQITNTYNSFNQLTTTTGISWNTGSSIFEFALGDPRHNYYYGTYNAGSASVKNVTNNGGDARIYPVPAQNTLNVDLKWDIAQSSDITIYDAQGRTVRHWQTPSATEYTTSVSVDNLSAGVYFVKINGAVGQIVKQLVVAH